MFYGKSVYFLISLFFMMQCMAQEKMEHLIFSNIILEPVLIAAEKNGVSSHDMSDILSGKVSSGYQTSIYFHEMDAGSSPDTQKFKISMDQAEKSFIVIAKNQIIFELTEMDGDKQRIFYRPASRAILQAGNETHRSFSQNLMNQAFQKADLFPVLVAQGRKSIEITILSVRRDQDTTTVWYKLDNTGQVMLLGYTKEIVTGNNCFQMEDKGHIELWGIHAGRQGYLYFLSDLYVMNKKKDGFYCEFFPSGLIKNFVDSKAGRWGKQKVWNSEGAFEAEYGYPPGKIDRRPPVKDFFPDWIVYMEGVKSIRYDQGEYWDTETKSPRYSALLHTFQYGRYGITFYFSQDENLLHRKYEELIEQKKMLYASQPDFTFVENTKTLTFVGNMYVLKANDHYRELVLKKDNMIIVLETQNNPSADVDKIAADIIQAHGRAPKSDQQR